MLNIPEPADGTRLVTEDPDGHLTIIWRDDTEARLRHAHPADRWAYDHHTDSVSWEVATHDAIKIYRLVPLDTTPTSSAPAALFSAGN
jgi:hypothetical protein